MIDRRREETNIAVGNTGCRPGHYRTNKISESPSVETGVGLFINSPTDPVGNRLGGIACTMRVSFRDERVGERCAPTTRLISPRSIPYLPGGPG